MIIKLGDIITDDRGRTGELINIGIAMEKGVKSSWLPLPQLVIVNVSLLIRNYG